MAKTTKNKQTQTKLPKKLVINVVIATEKIQMQETGKLALSGV
jgi:hypothetical protein